jgi:hypothetical protein
MDQFSLVIEQITAGSAFLDEFEKTAGIAAAFWLKASEEDAWYLYVASDNFSEVTLDVAYGEVLRIADQMRNPYFDPFQVKLIKISHPLAKAATEVLRLFAGTMATRLHRCIFGGVSASEVYIYPKLVSSETLSS